MASEFRYAFLIAVGFEDASVWNAVQIAIEGDNLRLYQVLDMQAAVQLAFRCHQVMSDEGKSAKQAQYFNIEEAKLSSSRTAKKIFMATMSQLGVPSHEAQLISEGFPSIACIMHTPREVMNDNSPASATSITTVTDFFGAL